MTRWPAALGERAPHIGSERGRPRHAQPQRCELADARARDEPHVHRRHAEEERRRLGRREVEHAVGAERRDRHARARQQRAVHAHAETVHVEERQREHESVVGSPSPRGPHTFRARERVAVAQDRALRPTGRARGEHEHRRVVGALASSTGDRPLVGRPSSEGGQLGASGRRAGSSSIASFGRASFHTLPSSLGPNAVLTGTTIAPSRSAATSASTRSADGGQLISTRSPGSTPAAARRAAAAALLCSTSAAVIHGVSVSRSTRAFGAAAHREAHTLGSDSAATRSAGSPSNPCWRQAARSSRGPDRTWSACQARGAKAASGSQGQGV